MWLEEASAGALWGDANAALGGLASVAARCSRSSPAATDCAARKKYTWIPVPTFGRQGDGLVGAVVVTGGDRGPVAVEPQTDLTAPARDTQEPSMTELFLDLTPKTG